MTKPAAKKTAAAVAQKPKVDKHPSAAEAAAAAKQEPSLNIAELQAKRSTIVSELNQVEKQIRDLEDRYITQSNHSMGTAVTGYEGFLTGIPGPQQNMRYFSESSTTGTGSVQQ